MTENIENRISFSFTLMQRIRLRTRTVSGTSEETNTILHVWRSLHFLRMTPRGNKQLDSLGCIMYITVQNSGALWHWRIDHNMRKSTQVLRSSVLILRRRVCVWHFYTTFSRLLSSDGPLAFITSLIKWIKMWALWNSLTPGVWSLFPGAKPPHRPPPAGAAVWLSVGGGRISARVKADDTPARQGGDLLQESPTLWPDHRLHSGLALQSVRLLHITYANAWKS